jgi:hypothetical protein
MRDRLDKIRRILGVEQQLRRAAEARLAELDRREAEIRQAEGALLAFLAGGSPHPGLAAALAGGLKRRAAETAAVQIEKEAQARLLKERYGREKRAERLVDAIAEAYRKEAEKRELQLILEDAARASLP